MIGYKYVIKRLNQYYPLLNFGIDSGKIRNCPRYRLNIKYDNPQNFYTLKSEGIGYHFFKCPNPKYYSNTQFSKQYPNFKIPFDIKNWEKFLIKTLNKKIILTCLECKIHEILSESEYRIIAKSFTPMREYYETSRI